MVGIVEAAEESLLARMFAYGRYRRKRQVLSAAVCDYLKDVLNGIAEEGRLDFSEEGGSVAYQCVLNLQINQQTLRNRLLCDSRAGSHTFRNQTGRIF